MCFFHSYRPSGCSQTVSLSVLLMGVSVTINSGSESCCLLTNEGGAGLGGVRQRDGKLCPQQVPGEGQSEASSCSWRTPQEHGS